MPESCAVQLGLCIHHPGDSCCESAADPEPRADPSLCLLWWLRRGGITRLCRTDQRRGAMERWFPCPRMGGNTFQQGQKSKKILDIRSRSRICPADRRPYSLWKANLEKFLCLVFWGVSEAHWLGLDGQDEMVWSAGCAVVSLEAVPLLALLLACYKFLMAMCTFTRK